jgi:hypothetical protein
MLRSSLRIRTAVVGIGAAMATASLALASPEGCRPRGPRPHGLAGCGGVPGVASHRRLAAHVDLRRASRRRRGADYFVSVMRHSPGAAVGGSHRHGGRELPSLARRSGSQRATALAPPMPPLRRIHTVAAHRQHLSDVAAAYPALATVVDYTATPAQDEGPRRPRPARHRITKRRRDCASSPTAPKPRSGALRGHPCPRAGHGRDRVEMDRLPHAPRTASDTTVTNLLDTTEIWWSRGQPRRPRHRRVGRNSPYYQRKNANDSRGSCSRPRRARTSTAST